MTHSSGELFPGIAAPRPATSPQAWRLRLCDVLAMAASAEGRLRDLPVAVFAVAMHMGIQATTQGCTVEYDERALGDVIAVSRDRTRVALTVLRLLGFLAVVHPGRGTTNATVYQLTIPADAYLQRSIPEVWAYLASKGIKPGGRKRDTTKAKHARTKPVDNPIVTAPDDDRRHGHDDDRRDGHQFSDDDRRHGHSSYKEDQYLEKAGITGVPEATTEAVHSGVIATAEIEQTIETGPPPSVPVQSPGLGGRAHDMAVAIRAALRRRRQTSEPDVLDRAETLVDALSAWAETDPDGAEHFATFFRTHGGTARGRG